MRAPVLLVVVTFLAGACAPAVPLFPATAEIDAPAPRGDPTAAEGGGGPAGAAHDAGAAADVGGAETEAPEVAGERDPAPGARPPRPGEVAIDEILVDPAGTDLGREWIEVASLADEPLDLSALHVGDATGDAPVDGGTLPARGLAVLGQSADQAHNGGAPVDRAYGTRLIFNNDVDRVAICLGPCADGVVLDTFTWDGTLGPAYVGHAVVIDRAAATICPATAPFGTEGSFGTPGAPDTPCPSADGGPSP
jgi:hypothetical protein